MKLSELLERDGLSTVNDRTNISIDNLLKLVDNDFEELNRVKAIGFLSILKREYEGIELDEIENSINEYFKKHTIEDDEAVLVTVDRTKKESGFLKWFIVFALLGGLWYLYNGDKLGGNLSNTESKENKLKDSEILQSIEDSVETKKDINSTEVKIQTEDSVSQKSELNSSTEIESNKTTESTEKKSDKESNNKSSDKPKKLEDSEDIDKVIDKAIDSAEETIEEKSNKSTDEIIKVDENSIETSKKTTVNDEEKAEIIYNVTVNPRVNLWFGFINLDTKARKEFITTASTPIDVGEQRWVLVTGHGRLSVSSELSTLKVNDSAKHYFYIDSSEIREIDRAEFKTLNDGRGW